MRKLAYLQVVQYVTKLPHWTMTGQALGQALQSAGSRSTRWHANSSNGQLAESEAYESSHTVVIRSAPSADDHLQPLPATSITRVWCTWHWKQWVCVYHQTLRADSSSSWYFVSASWPNIPIIWLKM